MVPNLLLGHEILAVGVQLYLSKMLYDGYRKMPKVFQDQVQDALLVPVAVTVLSLVLIAYFYSKSQSVKILMAHEIAQMASIIILTYMATMWQAISKDEQDYVGYAILGSYALMAAYLLGDQKLDEKVFEKVGGGGHNWSRESW